MERAILLHILFLWLPMHHKWASERELRVMINGQITGGFLTFQLSGHKKATSRFEILK